MKPFPGKKVIPLLIITAIIYAVISLIIGTSSGESAPSAELILKGGAIYTMDAPRSWAQSIAIADGRIIYTGTDKGAEKFLGSGTKVIDLKGKMVLPGFHDSHEHPIFGGLELGKCDLHGSESLKELFSRIASYASEHKDEKWITGGGWDPPLFQGGYPRKADLDALIPDRPAFLLSSDGHSAWVNSAALKIAGIGSRTKDPEKGRIERNPGNGEPSGTLHESAMELVEKFIPEPTHIDRIVALKRALKLANSLGITSLQEASADRAILDEYAELDRKGELTARVVASMRVEPKKGEKQIDELIKMRESYKGARLRATGAKFFVDGVLESHTAALLLPYLDRPGVCGDLLVEPMSLNGLVTRLDREDFQVHIHAIGDRAIRVSLDAFEKALAANGERDNRHHIAHLELIDPADIPRFRKLNVTANFQPFWACRDIYIIKMTEPVLGPVRSRWLYPIGSVMRSGAVVAAGSDWNVSTMNPLDAMEVAITRHNPREPAGPAWIPEECVDLPAILAAYTINGAWLAHEEKETGSLETGKAADLIVLDRNLFAIRQEEIHNAQVLLTLLEGKVIYGDLNKL